MVIRQGDDLSKYIDTSSARKVATDENGLLKTTTAKTDAPAAGNTPATAVSEPKTGEPAGNPVPTGTTASTAVAAPGTDAGPTDTADSETAENETAAPAEPEVKVKPRDNKGLFKDYMTSLASTLKSEVLSNKKIKKGSYFVMISYTIGTDGQVTITDLYVDPKQELLQQQIKERIDQDPPQLNPELNSAGVARKVNRKYSFTLDKE
jgi:hypothetical protein